MEEVNSRLSLEISSLKKVIETPWDSMSNMSFQPHLSTQKKRIKRISKMTFIQLRDRGKLPPVTSTPKKRNHSNT